MDQIIYKYTLEAKQGIQKIKIPSGAVFVSTQNQDDKITVWVRVSKSMKTLSEYSFYIVFTGVELKEDPLAFLATVQIQGLVYHVYLLDYFV